MSPPTRTAPAGTDTVPLLTTSPTTLSVPVPLTVMAWPAMPPHPLGSSAATVGEYRRLLTPPWEIEPSVGLTPFVSTLPNWSRRLRVAVSWKRLPCGPRARATFVSTEPSECVHVTVHAAAPGVPYPGEQDGATYSRMLLPKTAVAACSAET